MLESDIVAWVQICIWLKQVVVRNNELKINRYRTVMSVFCKMVCTLRIHFQITIINAHWTQTKHCNLENMRLFKSSNVITSKVWILFELLSKIVYQIYQTQKTLCFNNSISVYLHGLRYQTIILCHYLHPISDLLLSKHRRLNLFRFRRNICTDTNANRRHSGSCNTPITLQRKMNYITTA